MYVSYHSTPHRDEYRVEIEELLRDLRDANERVPRRSFPTPLSLRPRSIE